MPLRLILPKRAKVHRIFSFNSIEEALYEPGGSERGGEPDGQPGGDKDRGAPPPAIKHVFRPLDIFTARGGSRYGFESPIELPP